MTVPVTTYADGLPRRVLTIKDVEFLERSGIIGPDENYELIEGEIVPIHAKNHQHERVKSALNFKLARALPGHLWLGLETSLRLSEITLLEPDFSVYPKHLRLEQVRGPDILLAIEVADSTLAFDKGREAALYARFGVRELWVVDAIKLIAHIHRVPSAEGWTEVSEHNASERIAPRYFDGFALSLDELDII